MPYNNDLFGEVSKAITRSVYKQHYEIFTPTPPGSDNYLFQDGAQFQFQDGTYYLFN